ncbi:MAG: hypothetical protein IIZ23_02150 [Ruminococcus sp.]|nr:hypothetical protein [Ruminococcus sp.]
MDNHIYCCNRCGTIFESETDEDHCESCRALSDTIISFAQEMILTVRMEKNKIDELIKR